MSAKSILLKLSTSSCRITATRTQSNVTKRLDLCSEPPAFHKQAQLPSTSPHNFLTEASISFHGLLPRTPWQITDRQRNLCSRHCFQRHRNLSQTLNARKALARESRPLPHNVTIWGALDAPTLARVGYFINRCVVLFFLLFFLPPPTPTSQCRAPSVRVAMGEEAVYSLY